MSSSVNLPTFEEVEKLLHTKLNSLVQAINAKFAAGVSTSDLAWPITAQGHLNMSIYEVIDGKKIWGLVNANTYVTAAGGTLTDAVNAAGAGGVVVIPPNTTITASGDVNVSGLGGIVGFGASSVIKFTSGAASSLLRATSGTGMVFSNFMLDGNAEAGSINGFDLQSCTDTVFQNVIFKDFSDAALYIAACTNVYLDGVRFSGGAAEHVYAVKAGTLMMRGCVSGGADGVAILVDASGSADVNLVVLSDVVLSNCTDNAVKVLGAGAPGGTSVTEVYGNNVVVKDSGGATAAVILGGPADALSYLRWSGGRVAASSSGGLQVNASRGAVSGVVVDTMTTYGIDLDLSQYVTVSDCVLKDCATVGIDGSDCTAECVGHDNIFDGCTADVTYGPEFWPYGRDHVWRYAVNSVYTIAGPGSGNPQQTLTQDTCVIPAHVMKNGAIIRVRLAGTVVTNTIGDGIAIQMNTGDNIGTMYEYTASSANTDGRWLEAVAVVTGNTTWLNRGAYSVRGSTVSQVGSHTNGLDITAAQNILFKSLITSDSGATIYGWEVEVINP